MSGFLPSFGTMEPIDQALQLVQGAIASVLGPTFDVYRVVDTSNGSIFDGPPVLSGFPISPVKTGKKFIENQTFDLLGFIGTCDNRQLEYGDVVIKTGYDPRTTDVFVFAQLRELGPSIFVRC